MCLAPARFRGACTGAIFHLSEAGEQGSQAEGGADVSLDGQRGRAESRKRNGRPEGRPSCNPLPETLARPGNGSHRCLRFAQMASGGNHWGRFGGPSFL